MNSDSQGGKTAEAQEHLPPAEQFLYLPPSLQPYAYRIVNKLFYNRVVKKPDASIDLPRGSELPASFRYVGADGVSRSIGEFLNHNVVSGLLVLKNGQIVLEKYGLGLKDSDRWSTMSTVKSITAMLVGAAIKDGAIRSLDDTLETYLPKLAESNYRGVTLRHLLTMSSGMRWTEVYSDPQSDVNKYSSSLARGVPGGVLDLLCALPRDHAPGTNWLYNTGDTFLLGSVLTAAIKRPLASYLAEKIWGPCGCEQDAYYTLESPEGQEIGGSRAGVTLRDLSRFANFVLNDGVAPNGDRILPEGWVDAAFKPSFLFTDEQKAVGPAASLKLAGYGYSWWIGADGAAAALGFAGQRIWIDRKENLAIVTFSAFPQPPYETNGPDREAEVRLFGEAVREFLRG